MYVYMCVLVCVHVYRVIGVCICVLVFVCLSMSEYVCVLVCVIYAVYVCVQLVTCRRYDGVGTCTRLTKISMSQTASHLES